MNITIRICPVCGKGFFFERYNHEVCSVCGWIDDWSQTENGFTENVVNKLSLVQKRTAYNILNGKLVIRYCDDGQMWKEKVMCCKLYNQKIRFEECLRILHMVKDSKLDDEAAKKICTQCICSVDA